MFYLLYNILSLFLLVPVLLFTVWRSIRLKWPLALAARFGDVPADDQAVLRGRRVILLHAVSVGEIIAARPLLRALREQYPDHALVVSNGTDTGRQTAAGFPEVDRCVYYPFDFLPSVRRLLNLLNPSLVIIMETEIWPNFCRETARRGIPLVMANGRISDRSFPRYQKFGWFFRQALQHFTLFCMQTETARERIIAVGAVPERVVVAGNLKYDIPYRLVTIDEKTALRQRLGIPCGSLVITAGSTHDHEEAMILAIYQDLLLSTANLFLVLAPRHPQRCNDVAAQVEKAGIVCRRFTELTSAKGQVFGCGELLLVDTVGELMNMYALADMVFVGGSLVPVGGHNLLEPASLGVPAVFGPHMANFREIAALVLDNRAGVEVTTPAELAGTLRRLIDDPVERRTIGDKGLEMMRLNGGATKRHLELFAVQLPPA